MKILLLPVNVASLSALSAEYYNTIPGVEAICITSAIHKYQTITKATKYLPVPYLTKKTLLSFFFKRYARKKEIEKLIDWADVVHYVFTTYYHGTPLLGLPNAYDLHYAKKKKKAIFIEWAGSDIRRPEFLSNINRYYKHAYDNGYEYKLAESEAASYGNQKLFAEAGATPLLAPEMRMYIFKELFPTTELVFQRWPINECKFSPPSITNPRPLILHSPTARVTKGSQYIINTLAELSSQFDFEFVLLTNLRREEVLEKMQECDIFIDQIILYGYGSAAIEAMSMGKPVISNISEHLYQYGFPVSCPIVSANPDTLKEQLIPLLASAQMRHDIGRASRQYVEAYHDTAKISLQLLEIYKAGMKKITNGHQTP